MTVTPNWNMVTVRGKFVGVDGQPIPGRVQFAPQASRLVDQAALTTIIGRTIAANLTDGSFEIALPATDDPDITPTGFTYQVTEDFPGGSTYNISVPLSAVATGIELALVAPAPPNVGETDGPVTRLEFDALAAAVEALESGDGVIATDAAHVGIQLYFGSAPLPDPATMPNTVFFVIP